MAVVEVVVECDIFRQLCQVVEIYAVTVAEQAVADW